MCQQSPAQAMANELMALSAKTRFGHAKAAASIAEHVSTRDAETNLRDANNVKAAAQTASMVFGWQDQQAIPKIRLELVGNQQAMPVYDIESEVLPAQDWEQL